MDNKTTRKEQIYPNKPIDLSPDPNTNELIAKILDRDKQGLDQFGITMRQKMLQNPKDCLLWMQDALEESIDFSRYMIEAINSYRILNEDAPSNAAKIIVDENTLSYDFNRIKEVKTDGDVSRPGATNPGKGKGEKVSERKDQQTKKEK